MTYEPKYDNDYATKGYVDGLVTGVNDYMEIGYNKNFGAQPVPPYRVNDTWVDGSDLWVCTTQRLIGNFNMSDWTKAVAYVKPTDMETYVTSELGDFSENLDVVLADLQDQIDGVFSIWAYEGVPTLSNEPAVNWTTDEIKNQHLGDLYNDMLTGDSYRFVKFDGVYQWLRISDSQAAAAYDLAQDALAMADGKRRVFTTTPFTPYDIGDLWVETLGNPNSNIKICTTAKATGTLNTAHWELAQMSYNVKTAIDGGLITTGTLQLQDGAGVTKAGITANGTGDSNVRIWAGATYANRALSSTPFRVTQGGQLYATGANISGTLTSNNVTITGGTLNIGGSNFSVNSSGVLTANGANISGAITATSGSFKGAISSSSITTSSFSGGGLTLNSGGALRYYSAPGFLYCGGNTSSHPYVSALNVSTQGSNLGGVSFRDSDSRTNAGSEGGRIAYASGTNQFYIGSSSGKNIMINSGNNINIQGSGAAGFDMSSFLRLRSTGSYVILGSYSSQPQTPGGRSTYIWSGSHLTLRSSSSSTYVYAGQGTGTAGRIAVATDGPSSLNLKENIKHFTTDKYKNSLKLLRDMNIYEYDYKYKVDRPSHDFGFIIDEVELLPESKEFFNFIEEKAKVTEEGLDHSIPAENPEDTENVIEYKRYNLETLTKYLLTVCKAQQEHIDSLEERLKKLEEK